MGRLSERLGEHEVIGLDTGLFIYHLEANPAYLPLTSEILRGLESGRWRALSSVITLMELTVPPWRQEREAVAREYEALLVSFPNLHIVEIDREIARRGAQLRARFRLRPADALQVAAAMAGGATAFLTNDRDFVRVTDFIDVIILDDHRE